MAKVEMLFGLEARHHKAGCVISDYASHHRVMDGIFGGISNLVPVPFISNAATAALVAAQTPLVYRPLSRKIAAIYLSSHLDPNISFHNESNSDEKTLQDKMNSFQNTLNSLSTNLFGLDFLLEIARDITGEIVVGGILAAIPLIGMGASIALDAMIASTMTWRVGVMTALYCCNLQNWVGSRAKTYEISKKYVGPLSAKSKSRVKIFEVVEQVDLIKQTQQESLQNYFVKPLLDQGKNKLQILDEALRKEIPLVLIRDALASVL